MPAPTKRSPMPVRFVVATYSIVLILSTWIVAFLAQSVFWIVTKPFMSAGKQVYYLGLIFRQVSALVTALNPFWSFTVHGKLPAERPKKLVVMCNHVSNLDPFITCRALLPWESKYIAKSSLFQVPFGGWAMSLSGDIPVYFTAEKGGWGLAKGSVGKMMTYCKWLVENDCPIMVFPEGVRSGSMQPRDYKLGMFHDNDCAILPIALNNTHKAWSRKDVLDTADIHVALGEVMHVDTTNVEALKDKVRAEILRLTASLPNTCNIDAPAVVPAESQPTATATKQD